MATAETIDNKVRDEVIKMFSGMERGHPNLKYKISEFEDGVVVGLSDEHLKGLVGEAYPNMFGDDFARIVIKPMSGWAYEGLYHIEQSYYFGSVTGSDKIPFRTYPKQEVMVQAQKFADAVGFQAKHLFSDNEYAHSIVSGSKVSDFDRIGKLIETNIETYTFGLASWAGEMKRRMNESK